MQTARTAWPALDPHAYCQPVAQGPVRLLGVGGRLYSIGRGEVAERLKAAVLKTVERELRGFESHPLRQLICTGGSQPVARDESDPAGYVWRPGNLAPKLSCRGPAAWLSMTLDGPTGVMGVTSRHSG